MTTSSTVFTVGHSTMAIDDFVSLLRAHNVTAVADVRSQPHSRMNPQFNLDRLRKDLLHAGIKYVFLGKELGARASDPTLYSDGAVSYERLGNSELFQEGLQRVSQGASSFRVVLMCAERDPIACHRAILVARRLHADGTPVMHILNATTLESQEEMESRLLKSHKLPEHDMFRTRADLVASAYALQERRIAYRPEAGSSREVPDHESQGLPGK